MATLVLAATLVDATSVVSATWLALGGILVALREFWRHLRNRT